jgi:hypothetical protein
MTLSRDDVLHWLNERLGCDVSVGVRVGDGSEAKFALLTVGTLRHAMAEIGPAEFESLGELGIRPDELTGGYTVGQSMLALNDFPDLRGRTGELSGLPMIDVALAENLTLRILELRMEENDG